MFEFFDLNTKLLEECKLLIKQHNDLSYRDVELYSPSIYYSFISSKSLKDTTAIEIAKFYESFTSQMISIDSLTHVIDLTLYTSDELSLHIDRSGDSIAMIFSSLIQARAQLIELHMRIVENINRQIDVLIESIHHVEDLRSVIDTLFICMNQSKLGQHIIIKDDARFFISVGVRIIERLYNQIEEEHFIEYVNNLNNQLKQSILSTKIEYYKNSDSINRLQTFGLVPDDGPNYSLSSMVDKLFGIEINIEHLNDAIETLHTALSNINTGLLVVVSTNADVYFDMSALASVNRPIGSQGVTSTMIHQFDLVKQEKTSNAKQAKLISINDDGDIAYLVWTNDMKTFKIRKAPINKETTHKLIRRSPSLTVEVYNAMLMQTITDLRTDNDVSEFKRVQYMTFNDTTTEDSFLEKLKTMLVSALEKDFNNKDAKQIAEFAISDAFANSVLDVIDLAKVELGIHTSVMPTHCHIIYASMANQIITKLKKGIMEASKKLTTTQLRSIVSDAINGNDNIYTRVIASYYLHIAN